MVILLIKSDEIVYLFVNIVLFCVKILWKIYLYFLRIFK